MRALGRGRRKTIGEGVSAATSKGKCGLGPTRRVTTVQRWSSVVAPAMHGSSLLSCTNDHRRLIALRTDLPARSAYEFMRAQQGIRLAPEVPDEGEPHP